ncbi:glycoside hydrolase family 47 protein [Hydnum rufescens UP504]|uniref:alpha-1,2-Mannosidase n=1 Tax=Hydnum rufescens UP504 TaxID=1448309 RepID=A0A9P6B599_9AGAM|nr:glycoside hydrolase family 47 protein [Hydnum rufescens UP504]
MLPLHRLAQSQSAPTSKYEKFASWLRSRLATRILSVALIVLFLLFWLFPPFPRYDSVPLSEIFKRPSAGAHYAQDSTEAPPSRVPAAVWHSRAQSVKESFIHAYHGYEAAAFGWDELLPVTNKSTTNFNGWGVTIVDSLSTMLLMDLKDEYTRALAHVSKIAIKIMCTGTIPFFETVIRYLGGLLSAYALSGDAILLTKADELAQTLLPVFDSPKGMPHFGYDPSTGFKAPSWASHALLAEMASCQLEYKYLAHLTGRAEYFQKVDRMMDLMQNSQRADGLWSTYWDITSGTQVNTHLSIGALADSGYEYLLKQYLLTGKSEKRLLDMYLKAVRGVLEKLTFLSSTRDLLYITDTKDGVPEHRLEHLSCFFGGLLALGVETVDLPQQDADLHRWAAEGLTTTCWMTYAETQSGLGPEEAQFKVTFDRLHPLKWMDTVRAWENAGREGGVPPGVKAPQLILGESRSGHRDYYLRSPGYYLRPETVESIYIMWKVTKDEIWRERGWGIYRAIEKHCKTEFGYGTVPSVQYKRTGIADSMPSYFLAETLKYLYLLFSEEDRVPLDKWVFNTEAHPLPVFHWKNSEKALYGIHQ